MTVAGGWRSWSRRSPVPSGNASGLITFMAANTVLSQSRLVPVLLALGMPLLVIAILGATEAAVQSGAHSPALEAPQAFSPGFGPKTYDLALVHANSAVLLGRERVTFGPDQWLRRESLALGLLRRAQLTGALDDYAAALDESRKGMELAPKGGGPLLTLASVAMSTHVLDDTESALSLLAKVAVTPSAPELSEIAALRGDLAFYRGDMRGAAAAYAEADGLLRSAGTTIRLARLAKARGELEAARDWFLRSLGGDPPATPQLAGQIALQIGGIELARGNYTAARLQFETANRLFPGHWLVEAHLAQSKALGGDISGAISDMRSLAGRTGHPDVLDALALMLRAEGRVAESRMWADRAGALWTAQMEVLPEAALGHAIEHELAFGSPERAVTLARRNADARPYGEAYLLLGQALMQTGDFKAALAEVRRARASGWNSASLHALESNLLLLLGRSREASEQRELALARNPRIFDAETALIWFSHG